MYTSTPIVTIACIRPQFNCTILTCIATTPIYNICIAAITIRHVHNVKRVKSNQMCC